MRQAVIDALLNEITHQWMQPDRSANKKRHARVSRSRRSGECRDVFLPVFAGRQKVRTHDNSAGAALDAARKRSGDGRLGQLHVGRLDNGVVRVLAKHLDERFEHGIRRWAR